MLVAVAHQQQLTLGHRQSVMMAVQVHLVQLPAQVAVVAEQIRDILETLEVAAVADHQERPAEQGFRDKGLPAAPEPQVDLVVAVAQPAQANQEILENQILTAVAVQV
jgi:hypothetical protein